MPKTMEQVFQSRSLQTPVLEPVLVRGLLGDMGSQPQDLENKTPVCLDTPEHLSTTQLLLWLLPLQPLKSQAVDRHAVGQG